jgi:hypothetical protein
MRARILSLLVIGLVVAAVGNQAFAFSRQAAWGPTTDPKFPIVPVFGCPGRFATFFPGIPWPNILSQAMLAMNEWFTGGGADIRMRYEGDLSDSDPRCVNETPDDGTILISAEKNNGSGQCFLATTFYNDDGMGHSTSSLVIMHAGTVCNGPFQPWDWATNADYPGATPAQFDFQSVFLHELGHAIGFNHSTDQNAVMFAFVPVGDTTKRILADDDVRGLFGTFPYSPSQLTMFDVWSPDNGSSWQRNVIGNATTFAVGSPAACINNDTSSDTYQGAWTTPYPYQTISTFTFQSGYAFGQTIGGGTEMAPGVACGSDRTWYGWTNAFAGGMQYFWNVGGTWVGPFTIPLSSGVSPAAAEVHDSTGSGLGYLLVFADPATGAVSTLYSSDKLTFPTTTAESFELAGLRSFHGLGVSCFPKAPQCTVIYADGNSHSTPMMTAVLSVSPGMTSPVTVTGGPTPIAGSDGYGGAPAFNINGTGNLFVWRDRGFNTVLASTANGTSPIQWSNVSIETAPTVVFANHYLTYAVFYSFADRYNAH